MLCWRAIFLTCRKKLLECPDFCASERTRPGFGRKRFSSSPLMAKPPETASLGEECREEHGKCRL